MNCTICNKPVVLIPSASERARKFGGTAESYTRLFTEHAECLIAKRNRETSELIARRNMETFESQIVRGNDPEFFNLANFKQ
jgi:hypothetical protein